MAAAARARGAPDCSRVRVCLAYDCLYPWTVGGAERWYRSLAERLAADGHEVTYLTRLQWDAADPPSIPGVRVVAVSRADELYGPDGNRRVAPPLRFGWGVLRHLLRQGRDYDVVHLCSFPYFSVLAAALARPRGRYRLVVDWFEIWSRDYWAGYLGPVAGRVGYAVQRLCVRVPQRAQCFSRLHEARLLEEGLRGEHVILGGLYTGDAQAPPDAASHAEAPRPADGLVVFAGRHIAEKRAPAAVEAIARARAAGLDVHGVIFGDGPQRPQVLAAIERHGLTGVVSAPGFAPRADVDAAMGSALCLLHPSEREGYGLVVIESSARGTPVVVAAGPDNAAVELVDAGENGVIASSAAPDALAAAIRDVSDAGEALRTRTRAWFERNRRQLSIDSSLELVAASYAHDPRATSPAHAAPR
jgi:glycosyltransferase involved in cell wall biosynthesis